MSVWDAGDSVYWNGVDVAVVDGGTGTPPVDPEDDPNTETLVASLDGGNGVDVPIVVGTAPGYAIFNAHGSEGTELTFAWDFGDGQTGEGSYVSHLYQNPGSYTATLTVTNSVGRTATSSQTVLVLPGLDNALQGQGLNEYRYLDVQDIGNINTNAISLQSNNNLTINMDVGNPVSGVAYLWDFGDGNTSTGSRIQHTYASIGTYTVTLSIQNVADGQLLWEEETWFTLSSDAPEAQFTLSNPNTTDPNDPDEGTYFGSLPLTIDVDASSSTVTSGGLLTYEWNFGDGSAIQQGAQASHTYTAEGLFPITLTVTDTLTGLTDTSVAFARPHLAKNLDAISVVYETRLNVRYPNNASEALELQSLNQAQATGTRIINEYSPYVYYIDDTVRSTGFVFDHAYFDCPLNDGLYYVATVNGGNDLTNNANNFATSNRDVNDATDVRQCTRIVLLGNALTTEMRSDVRPNSEIYIATQEQTLTYQYDAIAGLRVPRVYVAVVPDSLVPGEFASPYVQEYIAQTPDGDEYMMVARVRSRDIVNGSIDLDVPVYAVDGNGNHAAQASGYFHAQFVDLPSDCDDCVMVDGKSSIRVRIPVNTGNTNPVPIDLSRIEISRDGTCNFLNERSLGVSTSGCVTVATSNAVPTAAPALPNFDVPLPLAAVLNGNAVRLGAD
jgi:PKD repeat protein